MVACYVITSFAVSLSLGASFPLLTFLPTTCFSHSSPAAPLRSQLRLATLGLQAVVVSGAGQTAKKGKGNFVPRSRKTDHFRGLAKGRRGRKNVRRRSKILIGRSKDFGDRHKRKIESLFRFRTPL